MNLFDKLIYTIAPRESFNLGAPIMTKIQPCFFFIPREKLYTGEETPLDLLLNRISLSNDIQNHINKFLGEELEHPYMWEDNSDTYLICHDNLNNKYAFPIDADEKHCFEYEIEDDFVVDDEVFEDV